MSLGRFRGGEGLIDIRPSDDECRGTSGRPLPPFSEIQFTSLVQTEREPRPLPAFQCVRILVRHTAVRRSLDIQLALTMAKDVFAT